LIKDFDHFVDRRHMELNPDSNKYFVHMVSAQTGDEWRHSRTLLTPIFTSGKLKGIMSAVHDSTDDFMDFLAKNNNDDLEVKDTMQICTCEILARIGCGVKPDILKDPENNLFYKQLKILLGKTKREKDFKWQK